MNFQNKDWSVIAYANGWTCWHYVNWKTSAAEIKDGFFNSVSNLMNKGDKIVLNLKDAYMEVVVSKIENRNVCLRTISTVMMGDSDESNN